MRAGQAAVPGLDPGRDKFLERGFSGFSSPVRQTSGSFRPQGSRISFVSRNHPFISPSSNEWVRK